MESEMRSKLKNLILESTVFNAEEKEKMIQRLPHLEEDKICLLIEAFEKERVEQLRFLKQKEKISSILINLYKNAKMKIQKAYTKAIREIEKKERALEEKKLNSFL